MQRENSTICLSFNQNKLTDPKIKNANTLLIVVVVVVVEVVVMIMIMYLVNSLLIDDA